MVLFLTRSHDFFKNVSTIGKTYLFNSYFFSAPARHLPEKRFLMFFSVPLQQITWMRNFSQSIRRNLIKTFRDQKFRTLWMWLPLLPICASRNIAILSQKSQRSISIQYLIFVLRHSPSNQQQKDRFWHPKNIPVFWHNMHRKS